MKGKQYKPSGPKHLQCPYTLIVIAFCPGLIWGHVVIVGPDLDSERFLDEVVVLVIPSVCPIIDQARPDSTGTNEVVFFWEETYGFARFVSPVVRY